MKISSNKKPTVKQEEKPRRHGGARRYNNTRRPVTALKFKGKMDDLEGHVFNVGVANQSQLFENTTKEIAEYAGRSLKESQDIRLTIEKVEDITFTIPKKRPTTTDLDSEAVKIIYKTELDGYIKRSNQYRQNKSSMYAIVFGPCTEWMRAKIEGDPEFETIKDNSDVIAVLKLILNITFNIELDRNPFVAQVAAIKNFVNFKQAYQTTNDVYLEKLHQ